MGQRANLIIKKNNQWQLYYDHWCANVLDQELFWGEQYAYDFITQREPDENLWLDEAWCEGACILDYDNQYVLWFGGEDVLFDVTIREAHLLLMKQQWSDWKLSWANNGIFDIGEYLDLPRSQFISKNKRDENDAVYSISTENPELDNMLLSVCKDNRIQYSQIYGNTEMLERGTQLLDNLLTMPLHDAYQWQGLEFPELDSVDTR